MELERQFEGLEWPRSTKVKQFEVLKWLRTEKERQLKLIDLLFKTSENPKGQKEAGCSAQSAEGTATRETLGRVLLAQRGRHSPGKQMQDEACHTGRVSRRASRYQARQQQMEPSQQTEGETHGGRLGRVLLARS